METDTAMEASSVLRHSQPGNVASASQHEPAHGSNEAAEEQAAIDTPIWPASPPPSGYATPAMAITYMTADAQSQHPPLPGSPAVHAGYTVRATRAASHGHQDWHSYTAVSLATMTALSGAALPQASLQSLPNELLLHILDHLDVCDLLATSRVNHVLRTLSLAPILHQHRLQRTRLILPPLLSPANRPSLSDLATRSIFLTTTSVVSRKLARSLVSIRLSRRLAARPSPESLVERCLLPPECVPGMTRVHVMPALVAKRKAIEKEKVKDGLRRWIGAKWRGEVYEKQERARLWDEGRGVGRVWRLTRFWERVGRGEQLVIR